MIKILLSKYLTNDFQVGKHVNIFGQKGENGKIPLT